MMAHVIADRLKMEAGAAGPVAQRRPIKPDPPARMNLGLSAASVRTTTSPITISSLTAGMWRSSNGPSTTSGANGGAKPSHDGNSASLSKASSPIKFASAPQGQW
jgi:hypothetical protein